MANNDEVIVEVDVGTVDNVVPIVDLLPKIADGLAEETKRAQADPNVPPEAEERFKSAALHARQLAQEIQQAKTMVPNFTFFAPPRGGPPGRPGRPGGPGRPGRPR
jgi:hypothetical protein